MNRLLKPPSVCSSYIYELTDNTWSTLHVLNISYFYTSLGFLQLHIARKHDRCLRDKHMFRKEFYKMLVRIFLQHKQAHLFGTIVVINNLNVIGSICFNSHRTFETHFLRQSASTEAIFSSTWNLHAKSLCSEKLVSHDSNSSNSGTLKKIRREMFLDKLQSPLQFYNKNTSSTIVYDQGVNRLRKFILVWLGASLVLIELLFNWNTSACMYVIRLEQCRIIYFKMLS